MQENWLGYSEGAEIDFTLPNDVKSLFSLDRQYLEQLLWRYPLNID